ncbi:MAG TPA: hypothetical protein PK718_00210 [Candidatus Methanofastidiosa archaeon]|nr:hypothetical protein [Candidatus Methanofastidiosa archaeon]HPR40958.1 hypothetical protein [Candidatus Methanofastidiosa archaeon]
MYERIQDSIERQRRYRDGLKDGLICDSCDIGPCHLSDFDDDFLAPCGIYKEQVVLKNLSEKIVEGMSEYGVYKHNLTKIYDLDRLIRYASRILPKSIEYVKMIDTLFQDFRIPRMGCFGLGGLEKDEVNICAIGPPDKIYDLIVDAHADGNVERVQGCGAKGVNVVSLGAPGAEMAYQTGIPCIGNSLSLEDALSTGAIDSVHFGKRTDISIQEGIENFIKRDGNSVKLPQKTYYKTGLDVDVDAINRGLRSGRIAGTAVIVGASSINCHWDMDKLVDELLKRGYVVFINGAHLYKGTELDPTGPSVIHLGFCEYGKTLMMDLDIKPTILLPGWKNAKLLTGALGMLSEGYTVINGNDIFGSEKLKLDLEDRGLSVIKDQRRLLSLF